MHNTLELVLILLASAVLVVVVFRRLHLPAMLGYLLAGAAIGPFGLRWIPNSPEATHLAEFGLVFLMFSIGLEFSLPKLLTMRRTVFGLGGAQVGVSMAVMMGGALALGLDWRMGIALGGALAMSSTAIVSKLLAERQELGSLHGAPIIGVLLFQDLAVVPLLIIIPALAQPADGLLMALTLAVAKAAVVLSLLLFFGQRLMRSWFHVVARSRSTELFMLNVLLITLGLAWLTELAGLSLALGAFVAGILISETEYRYQVEGDIRPFRDILLGLFFVTVGMMLDLALVAQKLPLVLLLVVTLVLVKLAIVTWLGGRFGMARGTALRVGLGLAQAGEFGLVLMTLATGAGVVVGATAQVVLAAMILSMLLAPLLIEHNDRIVLRIYPDEWLARAVDIHAIAVKSMAADTHIIICGFGRTGQTLGRFFEQEGISFIALDHDGDRVREAAAAGESVVYGDAGRREVLVAAGLLRAKALVITYADVPAALKTLSLVRDLRPELPVIVRTLDDADLDRLKEAGAAEVVPEVLEGGLMLASHALLLVGIPLNRVVKRIRAVREQRYQLLRGFFPGGSDAEEEPDKLQPRLHSVLLGPGARSIGRSLGELELESLLVRVTGIRRHGQRTVAPDPGTVLDQGDVIVILGTPDSLQAAEIRLLQG